METSLHRELKERYGTGSGAGGRHEVWHGGYRVDAIAADGTFVEVQSGALGALRAKLCRLLPETRVRVVKPVVLARRIVRRARDDGADLSARFSPKRGRLLDVFEDLVGLVRLFPHPNLEIDVLGVVIDEVRVVQRRWPGYGVADRRLRQVVGNLSLRVPADLWTLLPGDFDTPFTTHELAEQLSKPLRFAQRVAYCLRLAGAADTVGKTGNRRVYLRTGAGRRGGSCSKGSERASPPLIAGWSR